MLMERRAPLNTPPCGLIFLHQGYDFDGTLFLVTYFISENCLSLIEFVLASKQFVSFPNVFVVGLRDHLR